MPAQKTRAEAIPAGAVKQTPADDLFPPHLQSGEWEDPIPLPGPFNTAGAEDSPFITPDGNRFFFFFTPDLNIPANEQLFDGATGIWWSQKAAGQWTEPERIILNDEVSLDGCEFVLGDDMWFCSARAGNYLEIDYYLAAYKNNKWTDWENAGPRLNSQEFGIGELHISSDGNTMYFGSNRPGGLGGMDLWKSVKTDGEWGNPVNLGSPVNSAADEYMPFLSSDGNELWFNRPSVSYSGPAILRSKILNNGEWGNPEEIISEFAGEPTLDDQGNIYFIHHYFDSNGKMIEADIYFARKK
ncbi:MAG: hypothetical protein NT056_06340 [Proteobacteria bacterium]|nr:hypothetical protein [Pseudomonadota bacterium]